MTESRRKFTLSDLSSRFGLLLKGDGDHEVDGVGTLENAGPGDISFLANRSYRKLLPETKAGAVLITPDDAESCPTNYLVADDPYLAYARLARLFDTRPAARPGIHPSAVVSDSVRLGNDVSIGAHAVIGDDCEIADACTIGPGTVLAEKCTLGEACHLHANVTLGHGVQLGARTIVHPGAVIGADGFGIAFAGDGWEKVPQLGSVVTGEDCEIGANTCIDRGAIGDTILEDDVRIDNLCQIGHNVRLGAHTAIAGTSGISGSTRIGKNCLIGGKVGIAGHLDIADRTTLSAYSQIHRSIKEPGTVWSGVIPSAPAREWNRNVVRLTTLNEMTRKIRSLEKQMEKLNDTEK